MKKTLHDEIEVFLSFKEGKIQTWDSRDANHFVEAANKGLDLLKEANAAFNKLGYIGNTGIPNIGRTQYSQSDAFCMAANDLICTYVDDGVTEDFVNELNETLSLVRYRKLLWTSGSEGLTWKNIADFNRPLNVEESAAYMISHLLSFDSFKKIRRCKSQDCKHYFFGPPNAKWCSKTCGSKHRVREKRKRDK